MRLRPTSRGNLPPAEASSGSSAVISGRVSATSLFSRTVSTIMRTVTSIKAATTRKMGVKDWSSA